MKTLVILSHPNFAASRVNKALSQVAKGAAGMEVRHLEGLYGTDTARIDARTEQDALRGADRIVFLYPMYWLNYCGMEFVVPFISSGFEPGEFGDDAVEAAAARFGKLLRGELSSGEYQI